MLQPFRLGLLSLPSCSDQTRRQPSLTHTVYSSLTSLEFKGVSEYLEGVVAQIEAPLLNELDIPQPIQFIGRAENFIKQMSSSMKAVEKQG